MRTQERENRDKKAREVMIQICREEEYEKIRQCLNRELCIRISALDTDEHTFLALASALLENKRLNEVQFIHLNQKVSGIFRTWKDLREGRVSPWTLKEKNYWVQCMNPTAYYRAGILGIHGWQGEEVRWEKLRVYFQHFQREEEKISPFFRDWIYDKIVMSVYEMKSVELQNISLSTKKGMYDMIPLLQQLFEGSGLVCYADGKKTESVFGKNGMKIVRMS